MAKGDGTDLDDTIWRLARRNYWLKELHDGTFLKGKITLEENKRLDEMLTSPDEESVYLARCIIKGKINGTAS